MPLIALLLLIGVGVGVLEYYARHPLLRLLLGMSTIAVLWVAQPPPMGVLHRHPPPRPTLAPESCAHRAKVSEADLWYCAGVDAAVAWHAEKFWAHFPARASALLLLLGLASGPALREVNRRLDAAGAYKEGRFEPPGAA